MRSGLILLIATVLPGNLFADDSPIPPKPPEVVVKRLGMQALDILRSVEKVQAFRVGPFQIDGVGNSHVGLRERKDNGKPISNEFRDQLIASLMLESTYSNGSSKGTQVGVAYRLTAKDGSRVEISCCLVKGDFGFVVFDAQGKVLKKGSFGGIRNAPKHPFRELAAQVFPDDTDIQNANKHVKPKPEK